jgi:hypothetical protein
MLKMTEQELKEFAEMQAETIVIRSYEEGNSKDERRKATKPERRITKSIIYGGLLAIREGNKTDKEINAIIDACELIAKLQLPEMNGYDTIYCTMHEWYRNNVKNPI